MQTYWYIEDLIYEEERDLNHQGIRSALAITESDFATTVFITETAEQVFYLQLRFSNRLRTYPLSIRDSVI